MQVALPRIWIITRPEHPDGPVAPIVRAIEGCRAGLVGVQLRAKAASDRDLVTWGHALRAATARWGCFLTLNRRSDVAQIVEADGVHLPEAGLTPGAVRGLWPGGALVGVSRHDRDGLIRAAKEKATYAFLSPVFHVPGKATPMGTEGFGRQIANVGIPTYGLGGIAVTDVAPLIAAGAHGIAVRRAIYDAHDPKRTLQQLLAELDKKASNGE
jgi:thiamine-phosphate pyrophosphorylase